MNCGLESSIKVTAISPGFVETEFAEVMSGSRDTADAVYARYPCLQPDDIASTVMHIWRNPIMCKSMMFSPSDSAVLGL